MKKKKEELEEVVETEVEVVTEVEETVEVTPEVEVETEVEETETPEVVEENQNGVKEVEPEEIPEVLTGVVTAAKLNVRELPNKASDVVCVISKDDAVTITSADHGDFYEVCTADGKLGFCMKQFIKLN